MKVSVKIEQTAKDARVTVHVNANDGLAALEPINQSVQGHKAAARTAKGSGRTNRGQGLNGNDYP